MSPVGKQYAGKFNYFDSITLSHRKTRIICYQPTADGVYYTNMKLVFVRDVRDVRDVSQQLMEYTTQIQS